MQRFVADKLSPGVKFRTIFLGLFFFQSTLNNYGMLTGDPGNMREACNKDRGNLSVGLCFFTYRERFT
jgi:hypothetical protein